MEEDSTTGIVPRRRREDPGADGTSVRQIFATEIEVAMVRQFDVSGMDRQ
jgi:hypothetical protein